MDQAGVGSLARGLGKKDGGRCCRWLQEGCPHSLSPRPPPRDKCGQGARLYRDTGGLGLVGP